MSDCPIGFTPDDKAWLDKLKIDMYVGTGPDNPSVTARLLVLENERDTVNKVHIALFGDGEQVEGLIIKFEKTLAYIRGSLKILAIVGALAVVALGWALSEIVPAAKLVIDDYYRNHPAAKQSLNAPSQQATFLSDKYYHTGGN